MEHRHSLRCLEPRGDQLVCRLGAPPRFPTAEAAARAWGRRNGITGSRGGWLYRDGRPFLQGWAALARQLTQEKIIVKHTLGDWRMG